MLLVLYAVDASGVPQQRLLINALPDWRVAKLLAWNKTQLRFNPAPQCSQPLRYALQPIVYDDQRYQIGRR